MEEADNISQGRQKKRRKKSKIMTPEKKMKALKEVSERNSVSNVQLGKEGLKEEMEESLPFQRVPVHTGPDTPFHTSLNHGRSNRSLLLMAGPL